MAETKTPRKKATTSRRLTAVKSPSHRQAMATGREEAAALRRYLEALRIENAPKKKGRKLSPEQIQTRIDEIDQQIVVGVDDPLNELLLVQTRIKLADSLTANEPRVSSDEYAEDFVKAAKSYSERKGITYAAWRQIGVPAVLLRKAGVSR